MCPPRPDCLPCEAHKAYSQQKLQRVFSVYAITRVHYKIGMTTVSFAKDENQGTSWKDAMSKEADAPKVFLLEFVEILLNIWQHRKAVLMLQ